MTAIDRVAYEIFQDGVKERAAVECIDAELSLRLFDVLDAQQIVE